MDKESNPKEVISLSDAASRLGVQRHMISFSETFVAIEGWTWEQFKEKLMDFDPDLQMKQDGIDMFDSELLLHNSDERNHVEIIWDESREHWIKKIEDQLRLQKLTHALKRAQKDIADAYR